MSSVTGRDAYSVPQAVLSVPHVSTQVELDTVLSDLEAADFEELVREGQFPRGAILSSQFVINHSVWQVGLENSTSVLILANVYLSQGFLFS